MWPEYDQMKTKTLLRPSPTQNRRDVLVFGKVSFADYKDKDKFKL